MVKRMLFIIVLLFLPIHAYAATYYMATTGSNSNAGTEAAPWLTLAYSFSQMSGGDTLIIEDGTYTGNDNQISWAQYPPVGSPALYTTIKARNDGSVVFDGQSTRWMFYVNNGGSRTNRYWKFEGLMWCRTTESNVYLADAGYVKFLRCGAYGAPSGNYVNFSIGRNDSYILLENCYAYGSGRYKFMSYQSSYIVLRQCVGRYDDVNAGGEPTAVFAMYSVTYGEVQNCVAIDANETDAWTNIGDRQGCFLVPCTEATADEIHFRSCIGLNVKLGGIQTAHNTDSSNVLYENVVIWDCDDSGDVLNMIRGSNNVINHCTFGVGSTSDAFMYWDGSSGVLTNSIVYGFSYTGGLLQWGATPTTLDYNDYYGNNNTNGVSGSHNQTVNPIYNASTNATGALKYICRIESGSNLNGLGSSSTDIGANVLTLIGTPGTLYGETGYATDTGVSMWPYPYETTIRSKMREYTATGVDGTRGFCADGETLTHYIWNYLGNVGTGEEPWLEGTALNISTTTLSNGTVGTAYSATVSASGGTSPYSFAVTSGSLPGGLSLGSSGAISGTPTTAGTSNFTVTVTDSDDPANTDTQALSLTIDEAGTPPSGDARPILSGRYQISGRFSW